MPNIALLALCFYGALLHAAMYTVLEGKYDLFGFAGSVGIFLFMWFFSAPIYNYGMRVFQ